MKLKLCIFSGLLLIGITLYFSIMSHSKANETFLYEHYYEEPEVGQTSDTTDKNEETTKPNAPVHSEIDWDTVNILSPTTDIDLNLDSITLFVNKEYNLPKEYKPSDLVIPNVSFSFTYYDDRKLMRQEAATALEALFGAAMKDGLSLNAVSAYRSYERQYEIFTTNLVLKGRTHTLKYSAIPGTSEHQTGLAIDVSCPTIQNKLVEAFVDTAEGIWLKNNAHLYGYIIRYPKEKEEITGYAYEPWHIRYVGTELATYLYMNDLTLDEYYCYTPSVGFNYEVVYYDIIHYKPPITATPTPLEEEENEDDLLENEELTEDDILDDLPKDEDAEKDEDGKKDGSDIEKPSKPDKVTPTPSTTPEPSVTPTPTPNITPSVPPTITPTPEEDFIPEDSTNGDETSDTMEEPTQTSSNISIIPEYNMDSDTVETVEEEEH